MQHAELAAVLADHRRRMIAAQHLGLQDGLVFVNGPGKPQGNGSLHAANKAVLKHAAITKHVTTRALRRTATDLLRHAVVDPLAAKAIIATPPTACASTTRPSTPRKLAALARDSRLHYPQ